MTCRTATLPPSAGPTCAPATAQPRTTRLGLRLRRAWRAWLAALAERRAEQDLLRLDDRTLADIGAPEAWREAARVAREREERLRAGILGER